MRLRLRELEDRAQMPQRAALRPALYTDRIELASREIETQAGKRDLALAIDEHPRLTQRDADMIAATVPGPLGERQQDAVGGEIASRVVAGRRWQQSRAIGALGGSAFMAKARHGLRHLLPAASMAEGPVGAIAVDRGADDARPKRRDLFGSEAKLGDHPRP